MEKLFQKTPKGTAAYGKGFLRHVDLKSMVACLHNHRQATGCFIGHARYSWQVAPLQSLGTLRGMDKEMYSNNENKNYFCPDSNSKPSTVNFFQDETGESGTKEIFRLPDQ
jgi:hypothetical protein